MALSDADVQKQVCIRITARQHAPRHAFVKMIDPGSTLSSPKIMVIEAQYAVFEVVMVKMYGFSLTDQAYDGLHRTRGQ